MGDIQEVVNRFSLPWVSIIEPLSRLSKMADIGPYTEALRSFSSLSDLYRIPAYSDSSDLIRQDVEDGLQKGESPQNSNSTDEEIRVSLAANTRSDDINRANQEYLDYLRSRTDEIANTIIRTEFEDGMDNEVTLLIKSFANHNKAATYNWLEELYSKNLNSPSIVQGVLRSLAMITARGDENILLPIVVASLRSGVSVEQEAAIMVIEEWRTKECLDALSSVPEFSSEVIADYAKLVEEELKRELG